MPLLFLQNWISDAVLKALGWTLLHSVWQGILAAAAAGIVIIATRRSAARTRYNLLGLVFILFLAGSVITFAKCMSGAAAPVKMINITVGQVNDISYSLPGTTDAIISPPTLAARFTSFFNEYVNLFVFTWALLFLFHGIKLATGLAGIYRIKNYRRQLVTEDWQEKLSVLSDRLGIRSPVRLFQSALVKVPVAVGYLRPVILIPVGLLANLPADQAETILLHELAHIRRNDYLINLLQRIAEAVYFFNPAFLWISSLIRQEREACCDDIVMAHTNSKGSYLEALVSFQEYSLSANGYAMAIGQNRHHLLNRVRRMMTRENKKLNVMEKTILVISLVTVTAFTMIPKKEAVAKKTTIAAVPFIQQETPAETKALAAIKYDMAPPPKHAGKKAVPAPAPVTYKDTVPPKKINYAGVEFKSMSTNAVNDEKTKTETTSAIDQNGKKYTINKVNDKVTSLSIDGNEVPQNEWENHAALFEKIDHAKAERRAAKEKRVQERAELDKVRQEKRQEQLAKISTDKGKAAKDREAERGKRAEEAKVRSKENREAIETKKERMQKDQERNQKEARKNKERDIRERSKEIEKLKKENEQLREELHEKKEAEREDREEKEEKIKEKKEKKEKKERDEQKEKDEKQEKKEKREKDEPSSFLDASKSHQLFLASNSKTLSIDNDIVFTDNSSDKKESNFIKINTRFDKSDPKPFPKRPVTPAAGNDPQPVHTSVN